jgi:hypothetical protein
MRSHFFTIIVYASLGAVASVVVQQSGWSQTSDAISTKGTTLLSGNLSNAAVNTDAMVPYFNKFTGRSGTAVVLANKNPFVPDAANAFRDAIYGENLTYDTTKYANPEHFNYGGRFQSFGGYNSSTLRWDGVYTSNVGLAGAAEANIQSPANGVSGVVASAYQLGVGTATNEFFVSNPAFAYGHARSMAAVQAEIDNSFGSVDRNHPAYAVLASNTSTNTRTAGLITAAFASDFNVAQMQYLLKGAGTNNAGPGGIGGQVTKGAILMPPSAVGDTGSRIVYNEGAGDFTEFDGANYIWNVGSSPFLKAGTVGVVVKDSLVIDAAGGLHLRTMRVAALPKCESAERGVLYQVEDAKAPSWNGALSGGGSMVVGARCNGESWVAF